MRHSLAILLAVLLLANGALSDFVHVFHTSQKQKNIPMKLEYPCQLDRCGCTKETCTTNCCCSKKHKLFKKTKNSKDFNKLLNASFKSKVSNTLETIFCEQNNTKKENQIIIKKEILLNKESHVTELSPPPIQKKQTLIPEYISLRTQAYFSPEKPPPNIA